jgi:DNA-binding XRE family transcriptional regulator
MKSKPVPENREGMVRTFEEFMATQIRNKKPGMTADQQIARLRAQVARLRAQVRALKSAAAASASTESAAPPPLPKPYADGNYPATATLRALLAQQIAGRREAAGWTQAELAARAGVRQETVCRIEGGKNAPNVATVDKLDRALKEAGA